MASWDDVRRIAMALPHVTEPTPGGWRVKDKGFVWERPLRKADHAALGDKAPAGPILGARVEAVDLKDVLIAQNPDVYFTTPHFNGYAAILVQLDHISVDDLQDLIVDAWLACAPKRIAQDYLAAIER